LSARRARAQDAAMHEFIRVLLLLSALVLGSCGGGGDAEQGPLPASVLGQEYLIGFGETIRIGSLALEFTTLAEESRCPLNANCVWAGNARILVTATMGPTTEVMELNTYPSYQVRAAFQGYLIELRRLQPDFPWAPRGPLSEYTATVYVDRASN
jgi:hypothetical protein